MAKKKAEIMRSETTAPMLLGSVNIEALIAKALEKESPLDVMEKLMAMRREMQADMARVSYYDALAKFQAACPDIPRTKKVFNKNNTHLYSFAPLDVIVAAIKTELEVNGLSYTVETEQDSESVTAICITHHRDGHSEKSRFTVPIDKGAPLMNAAQKVGAARSYAKRYAFCDVFGILTCDEDNDANTPGKPNAQNRESVKMPTERKAPPNAEAETIRGIIDKVDSSGGKKNGRSWERWGVKIEGKYYGTFSKTLGAHAIELCDAATPVIVVYSVDEKGYNNIVSIDEDLPPKPDSQEADNGARDAQDCVEKNDPVGNGGSAGKADLSGRPSSDESEPEAENQKRGTVAELLDEIQRLAGECGPDAANARAAAIQNDFKIKKPDCFKWKNIEALRALRDALRIPDKKDWISGLREDDPAEPDLPGVKAKPADKKPAAANPALAKECMRLSSKIPLDAFRKLQKPFAQKAGNGNAESWPRELLLEYRDALIEAVDK